MHHLPTQVYEFIRITQRNSSQQATSWFTSSPFGHGVFSYFFSNGVSELLYPGKLEIGLRSVIFFLQTNSTLLRGVYLVYDAQPHLHTRTLTRTLNGSSPLLMLPVLPLLAMAMNGLRHTQAESLRSSLCRIRVKFEISQI